MQIRFGELAEERLAQMSDATAETVRRNILNVIQGLPRERLPGPDEMLTVPVRVNDEEELKFILEREGEELTVLFIYDIDIDVVVSEKVYRRMFGEPL
ncbi:MAG TPA: hypothetical protein VK008_02350 [Sphingobacteriaceae bacterium]|nr:hypothetical protein [Sphingobacteriaceae bacterium]